MNLGIQHGGGPRIVLVFAALAYFSPEGSALMKNAGTAMVQTIPNPSAQPTIDASSGEVMLGRHPQTSSTD